MGGSSGRSGAEKRATRQQTAGLQQQMGVAGQLSGLAGRQDVSALGMGGLTPAEQMQMQMIDMGQAGMEQNVRDMASQRGMFSSAGAIAQEGMIPMQLAQQRADIYGMAQQRQFQGLGMQQGLLGTAMGGFGQAAAGFGGQAEMFGQQRQQQQQQMSSNIMNAGALIAAPFTGGASLAMYGRG
jgi:hypothetical protein